MNFPRLTKRQWLQVSVALALYGLSYYCIRSTHTLIHRVSHAGDTYYHWIDEGGSGWSPFGLVTVCYFVYTPLRWSEAFVWRFVPRKYDIY